MLPGLCILRSEGTGKATYPVPVLLPHAWRDGRAWPGAIPALQAPVCLLLPIQTHRESPQSWVPSDKASPPGPAPTNTH